jgi:hypothetical protein
VVALCVLRGKINPLKTRYFEKISKSDITHPNVEEFKK